MRWLFLRREMSSLRAIAAAGRHSVMEYNLLKYYRQHYGLGQGQLYDGILTPDRYSRFENSAGGCDYLTAEALLGRIGKDPGEFGICLNGTDFLFLKLRLGIEKDIRNEAYEKATAEISEYEAKMPEGHLLHTQFLLYQKSQLKRLEREDLSDMRADAEPDGRKPAADSPVNERIHTLASEEHDLLLAAWRLTKSSNQVLVNELYNPLEIRILLGLIHLNSAEWDMADIPSQLDTLSKKISTFFPTGKYTYLSNACFWETLRAREHHWDDLQLLAAIDDLIRHQSPWQGFRFIILLHERKAQVLARLIERPGDNAALREQFILECRMAYFAWELMHRDRRQQAAVRFCMEKTGVDIRE